MCEHVRVEEKDLEDPVTGSEISEAMKKLKADNPGHGYPYSSTPGFWNVFLYNFSKMGFKVVRK